MVSVRGLFERWWQRFLLLRPTDRETVTLRHRRIYILPTRVGLALLATVAIMLVASLNYALSLGFVVTFLLTGLIATALLDAYRNLAGMEIRAIAAGEAWAGGTLPFTLTLAGNGHERRGIALGAPAAATVVIDVAADGMVPASIAVAAATRGRLALGRLTIASAQPLGLWRAWSYVHFPLAGIVYPAPEPHAPPLPPGQGGSGTAGTARGEEVDLAGLRAYQPGDPLQRIAWKAVAKGRGCHTKEFEGTAGGELVTLAWNALPGAMEADARARRLAAWVLAADRSGTPFALDVPGTCVPAGKGREHRRSALTALALCAPDAR